MSVQVFFQSQQTDEDSYSWTQLSADDTAAGRESLTQALAVRIVSYRCPEHYVEAWTEAEACGTKIFGPVRTGFAQIIREVLGLPTHLPGRQPTDDHIQGFVAEALWRFLSEDHPHRHSVERIEWGWIPTDPGGDGLIIHRATDGTLSFRLWEIKKTTASGGISPTIARASAQLRKRAPSYIARYMKVGQELTEGEVKDFYCYLLDHWYDANSCASAGVSLVAGNDPVPAPCFHQLPAEFPQLCEPSRLRGLLALIVDYPAFCQAVQERVWIAL
jgi:hypothetical protein